MKYKLYSKGVKSSLIDEYISNNIEELEEYELKSACKIVSKKKNSMEIEDIKLYLLKKGYREENVREAIESIR